MEKDELLNFLTENRIKDKDAIKFISELEEIDKGIGDIPQMKRIQETLDEKFLNMLIDVNEYLIDEREKASSKSAKETIGKLIISNYRKIVEMKEGK